MAFVPTEVGEVPTLGWQIIDWIAEYLAAPDRGEYEPFVLYGEQEDFVLRFYELDPVTCRRRFRRGVISRPRGWGKSPFLAALACAEALGPVVPDGWDADGRPVGKPWSEVRTPLIQIAAVSETQTQNTWGPLLEMLAGGSVVDAHPGLEVMGSFVNLPRGQIQPITSSARTVKGNRACFAVLDQTEEWVKGNGGPKLAETMRINAAKVDGSTIESPNAFTPGEGSVAEMSAAYWSTIREGRAKDDGLYYDHREAPANTDLRDRDSLMAGLGIVYGDSADVAGGHVNLETIRATIWDPAIDVQRARADFLNQITHAADSWVTKPEWAGRYNPDAIVADKDVITLGFDGSRGRTRGVADATALVASRVLDGFCWPIGIWEQPDGSQDWTPPEYEVDAAVADAFARYTVVGFYADPTMWDEHVAKWAHKYGHRLKVKAGTAGPIRWPKNQISRVVRALAMTHSAITAGELSHDGSSVLTRHVLNARRRSGSSGIYIAKSSPSSPNKIDGAYSLMLAWQARLDALALGLGEAKNPGRGRVIALS